MSGFFSRWSARKSAETKAPPEPAAKPVEAEIAPPAGPSDQEIADHLAALPALDEITAQTDIRPFMADFVPATLRKAALRKAWLQDPIISTHLDVARDYAWDFNSGSLPVGFSEGLGKDAIQRGLEKLYPQGEAAREAEAEPQSPTPDAAQPGGSADPVGSTGVLPKVSAISSADVAPDCPKGNPGNSAASHDNSPKTKVAKLQLAKKHGAALPH